MEPRIHLTVRGPLAFCGQRVPPAGRRPIVFLVRSLRDDPRVVNEFRRYGCSACRAVVLGQIRVQS